MTSQPPFLSASFWRDFRASFVVFLVSLPLCLGVAVAAGAPVEAGIIAGIVGGLVVSFLSGSSVAVTAPSAALILVVASGLSTLNNFTELALATSIAGLLQIVLGRLHFGALATLIPSSVVRGMLVAIGIIIILKQIPHLLGVDADVFGEMAFYQVDGENTFSEIAHALTNVHSGAVVMSILSLAILWGWGKIAKLSRWLQIIPAPLAVVLCSVLVNTLILPSFDLALGTEHLVSIPTITEFINWPHLENLHSMFTVNFWVVSITICLVASVESLLSMDAIGTLDPHHQVQNEDRELMALGVGNFLSGLLGGLPMATLVVPTSANISAGALSKKSALLYGGWLSALVLFFPLYLSQIPLSALATILAVVGFKITELKLYRKRKTKKMNQWIPLACTLLAILFTNLLIGVAIGLFVGLIFVMISNYHSTVFLVGHESDYLLRFHKDTSFLNKLQLKKLLSSIPNDSELTIDGTRPVYIDDDVVGMIDDFIQTAPKKNIAVHLKKSPSALTSYFKDL